MVRTRIRWADARGTLAVDTPGTARSLPGAFVATATQSAGDQYPTAFVEHGLGKLTTSGHAESDILISAADPNTTGGRVFGCKAGVNVLLAVHSDGTVRVSENYADGSGQIHFAHHGNGKEARYGNVLASGE